MSVNFIVNKGSFRILHITKNPLQLIERCGRTAYQNQDKITKDSAKKFIQMLIARGHESVLEHATMTVQFNNVSRGFTHELSRHRLCSFCLSGKTRLISHPNLKTHTPTGKFWTIEQLYKWQKDKKRKGRIKLIRLRSIDKHGRIVPGKIRRVLFAGKKPLLEIRCISGRHIQSTKYHFFLTVDGWKQLKDLSIGDRIFANGLPSLQNKEWLERVYIKENNTLKETAQLAGCCTGTVTKALRKHGINKPLSMRKNRKPGHGIPGMHGAKGRKEISLRMMGSHNHQWKGSDIKEGAGRQRARTLYPTDCCWGCGTANNLEHHHMDKNPKNNTPANVKILCSGCHKSFHYSEGHTVTVFLDEIVSIKSIGVAQTYDLEMETKPPNFVANGIVVHNSQESTRYVDESNFTFVCPPGLRDCETEMDLQTIIDTIHGVETAYNGLTSKGWPAQDARQFLPIGIKSQIVITANFRQWRHIFQLRTTLAAHWEIRRVMIMLLTTLRNRAVPIVFNNIIPQFTKKEAEDWGWKVTQHNSESGFVRAEFNNEEIQCLPVEE